MFATNLKLMKSTTAATAGDSSCRNPLAYSRSSNKKYKSRQKILSHRRSGNCGCHNNNSSCSSRRSRNGSNGISNSCCHSLITAALLVLLVASNALVEGALRNVNLIIEPPAVRRGQHAVIRCLHDLDESQLYSAKFYRGQLEFYRYTPVEKPQTKVFPFPGIHVDVSNSNSTQVLIRNVGFGLSGNFSCEVTADAPLFSTGTAAGVLQVVELPEKRPTLFTEQMRYVPGDVLRANCSTPPSRPRAELKFTINNRVISNSDTQYIRTVDNLIASRLSLKLQLQATDFATVPHGYGGSSNGYGQLQNSVHGHHGGSLVLRCTAQIGDLYQEYKEIELGTPQKDPVPARVTLSSGSSMSNFFTSYFSAAGRAQLHISPLSLLLIASALLGSSCTAATAAELCIALLAILKHILTYTCKHLRRISLHSTASCCLPFQTPIHRIQPLSPQTSQSHIARPLSQR